MEFQVHIQPSEFCFHHIFNHAGDNRGTLFPIYNSTHRMDLPNRGTVEWNLNQKLFLKEKPGIGARAEIWPDPCHFNSPVNKIEKEMENTFPFHQLNLYCTTFPSAVNLNLNHPNPT